MRQYATHLRPVAFKGLRWICDVIPGLPVPSSAYVLHATFRPNDYEITSILPHITGSLKTLLKRKKNNASCKPLPPSKRLRLEAQRVLKERVQEIADKKGIKLRFCNLKECEGHLLALDSPCGSIRLEIGWPPGVPFVHPHDLPNKAKLGFLEAYEPGWAASQDIELSLMNFKMLLKFKLTVQGKR
ncbi:hypothetical protein GIB67_002510 [Kingdonia uniflora]|uniref:Uncharacterized protein n=1 Tax=Kingdonia uniflora TaxID=39325 RepID=A0A7J7N8M8_9MAGN|nr:hypothetical protein GIB67_002510 [Kingdonia uniflora]